MKALRVFLIFFAWVIAGIVAYIIWGIATPALCSLLPNNDWKGILSALIYFGVVGVGGIGLPLGIGIVGSSRSLYILFFLFLRNNKRR